MTVEITIGPRQRIWITSDRRIAGLSEQVAGANFAKTPYPHWTAPLSIESCLALRERFGSDLLVKKDLGDWFRDERIRRDRLKELSAATSGTLRILPEIAPKLADAIASRPFQAAGVRFMAEGGHSLIADDPGLGKTLQILGALVEREVSGPYLVVCPKTATDSVWAREIQRWLLRGAEVGSSRGYHAIAFPDGKARREAILNDVLRSVKSVNNSGRGLNFGGAEKTFVIINTEMAMVKSYWSCGKAGHATTTYTKKPTPVLDCGCDKDSTTKTIHDEKFPQLFEIEWGAIVVDESHESLVRKSGTPTQRRNGLERLRVRQGGVKIAASGTPMRGKPEQLWGTLNWLRPDVFKGFWGWAKTFWETGGYSGWELKELKEGAEEKLWDSLSPYVLRRTKAEAAPDMPAKTYVGTPYDAVDPLSPVGVWLDMTPAQKKAYLALDRHGSAAVEGGSLDPVGTLAERTRKMQLATSAGRIVGEDYFPALPSNKWDYIEEKMEELGFPGKPETKIVIVSQFTRVLRLFDDLLAKKGISTCFVTGDAVKDRREIIDAFNSEEKGSPQVMLLAIKAGGVALTIDSADHMFIVDEADSDAMIQVEDRIHRLSKPRPVFYHYLRSISTVDLETAEANAARARKTRRLLDVRRGVGTPDPVAFTGGPLRKIRRCPGCGVYRNQWHETECEEK